MKANVWITQARTGLWSVAVETAARHWDRFGLLSQSEAKAWARDFVTALRREPVWMEG
jgi:hypothetical protein